MVIDRELKNECYNFFFFKQKTAYEIGTGDWSSDVCSSDLLYDVIPDVIDWVGNM